MDALKATEDQIKAAIVHDESLVRRHALDYFSDAYSDDPEVMPRVIDAIDKFGWDGAFEFLPPVRRLAQTRITLEWLIGQLEQLDDSDEPGHASIQDLLGSMIAGADMALLHEYESAIANATGMPHHHRAAVHKRLRLADEPPEQLWRQLEAHCRRYGDKSYVNELDLPHAYRLVEAIAREPAFAPRVLEHVTVQDEGDGVGSLMEAFAIRLAGLMRLKEALPAIVAKLRIDADWLREECNEAIARIGGDDALEQLCTLFPNSEWHCRLYATGALATLRTERVAGRCLELAESEPEEDLRENLIHAALCNFASEAIDPARPVGGDLRPAAVAVSLVTGVEFPERDRWLADERARERLRRQRMRSMFDESPAELTDSSPPPGRSLDPDPEPVMPITSERKPGRNEPCPCGSGKKFKKCCMR